MLKSLDRECHSAGMKKYSLNDKQIPFSHFRNMKDFECESPIKIVILSKIYQNKNKKRTTLKPKTKFLLPFLSQWEKTMRQTI